MINCQQIKERVFTNCFLTEFNEDGNPSRICLALKKRGWGEGLWNGSGGKPEEGEPVETAACREVKEEFGVEVKKLEKRAEIIFTLNQEEQTVLMHTFLATDWEGEPVESEEMKPEWFGVDQVPYQQMWKSDQEWLPIILSGKRIKARFTYTCTCGDVLAREIEEVESFN